MQNLKTAFVVFLAFLIGVSCVNFENSTESDSETKQEAVVTDFCYLKCGDDPYTYCEGDQDSYETTKCVCPLKTQVFDESRSTCLTRCIKKCGSDWNIVCSGDQTTDETTICGCKDDLYWIYVKDIRKCSSVHCDPNPCTNGGTCRSAGGTFECACPDIYGGRTCSENIFCEKYGEEYCGKAACYVSKNPTEVHCICGFGQVFDKISRTCIDNRCHPNPCENGGTCVPGDSRYPEEEPYTCLCRSTHRGKNCTESIWCRFHGRTVCGDEAICQYNGNAEFSCICASDETFDKKLKICKGICKPNPCVHGTCIKDGKYANCRCAASYVGKYCDEEVIYPCTINLCQNGGSCSSYGPYFVCSCNLFHTGKNCQRVDLNMIAVVIVPVGVLGIGIAITIILIRRRNQKLKMISQRMEAYRAIQSAMPVSR